MEQILIVLVLTCRELWRNAIKQQILLDRMERENRRMVGKKIPF
jgi:hypothetical protein